MSKAEKYLSERINFMTDERIMLLTKIDETDLEIKEIEYKIRELKNSIDDTFEIFSPRTRKNDFIKNEIQCLEKEIDDLTSLREEYKKKSERVLEDIDIVKDILRENVEDNNDEFLNEDNEITDETEDSSDEMNMGEIESEKSILNVDYSENDAVVNGDLSDREDMERLVIEKERLLIAGKIDESILQSISNLIHKSEICEKVLEVDIGRAKLEIEMLNKALNELYNNIKVITGDLRKSAVKSNVEPVKKISVKKLSKDNFYKEK